MTATQATILQADKLTFNYPDRPLFSDWSQSIPAGITLVRGGDGRGKTSLLRLLAGDLAAQGGQLQLNGISLAQQAEAYRQQVFWVHPRSEAFDQMSVPEYFASVAARYASFDQSRLPALIAGLSLTPHMEKRLFMLSTGSKRKVWQAAAFASGAALNLIDDPFAGLDQGSINFVTQQLNQAATEPTRAWVLGMYENPPGVPLAALIDLGD